MHAFPAFQVLVLVSLATYITNAEQLHNGQHAYLYTPQIYSPRAHGPAPSVGTGFPTTIFAKGIGHSCSH